MSWELADTLDIFVVSLDRRKIVKKVVGEIEFFKSL